MNETQIANFVERAAKELGETNIISIIFLGVDQMQFQSQFDFLVILREKIKCNFPERVLFRTIQELELALIWHCPIELAALERGLVVFGNNLEAMKKLGKMMKFQQGTLVKYKDAI
jgi:hypothetical protein